MSRGSEEQGRYCEVGYLSGFIKKQADFLNINFEIGVVLQGPDKLNF